MLIKLVTLVILTAQAIAANVSASYHYEFGLNSTAYQRRFDELVQDGYRLTYISAHPDEYNKTLFTGVWKKATTSVPWVARHGLNGSQYDALSTQLKAQNYHPVVLNAYNLPSGEPRFATIWEKASVGTWVQQRDMTKDQLSDKVSALSDLRITTLTRYVVGNQVLFAATWGKRTAEDWHGDWYYSIGKTGLDHGPLSDGYKAISLNVYSVNGAPVFDVVWQRYSGGGSDFVPTADGTAHLEPASFETTYKYETGRGFGPRALVGYYYEGCGILYAGTFEKDS
ncbi:hypothetical protein DPV78_001349 [Talaromyces pinophilus]|nr:hypothetical protein DPV78_001349 [Talaromyces pinophilus]